MRVAQQVKRLLACLVEVVAVWKRQPAAGLGIDIGRQRLGVHGGLSLKRLCSVMPKRVGRTAPRLGAFQEHSYPHVERRVPPVWAVAPTTDWDDRCGPAGDLDPLLVALYNATQARCCATDLLPAIVSPPDRVRALALAV